MMNLKHCSLALTEDVVFFSSFNVVLSDPF